MEKLNLTEVIDRNFLGDWDLFVQVAEAFEQTNPTVMANLLTAIETEEKKKVGDLAHKVKGSVAHFHHVDPVKTARTLEEQWSKLTKAEMLTHYATLADQIKNLQKDLTQLCAEKKVA